MTRTLTLTETADVLKTTPETVSDCIHLRGLPAVKIGRAWVLVEADVIEWLRRQYSAPAKESTTCEYSGAAHAAPGGLTSPSREARALSAALAPRTRPPRGNGPPRLSLTPTESSV